MAKVLIIAPQWMGDAVMTHSLIQLVAKKNTVDVLCVDWLKPIYDRMEEVNKVITLPLMHGKFQLSLYWQLGRKLKGQYQQAIVIPRKLKSALIPWFAQIPKRIGYLGESRYVLINDKVVAKEHHNLWVEKICGLVGEDTYPEPKLKINTNNAKLWKKKLNQSNKKLVALMPGASYGISKQWPVENFNQLVKKSKNTVFVVLGGKNEQKLGEKIKQGVDEKVVNLCNQTSLEDAVDLLSICDECITNDSGLMHIAAATGCFVKALYGSSSPDYTPPLTDKQLIFSDNLDCKPCFERTCQFGHYDCWKKIKPERVM